jgi:hypothetical protein
VGWKLDVIIGSAGFMPTAENEIIKVKIRREITQFFLPTGLESMSQSTVALTAKYMNVQQYQLGIIIIQTRYVLQHDNVSHRLSARGIYSLAITTYFQIT